MIETLDYYPYGDVRLDQQSGGYENAYKYTGKELDAETDLYYYGARYYDAKIGRFVSVDPIVFLIGTGKTEENTGEKENEILANPQGLNSYSYVKNNPLTYTDPTGKWFMLFSEPLVFRPTIFELPKIQIPTVSLPQPTTFPLPIAPTIPVTTPPIEVAPAIPNTTSVPIEQSFAPSVENMPIWPPAEQSGCGINMSCAKDNSKQDKRLNNREIKKLEKGNIDPHDLKPNSKYDLFKNKKGEIKTKPKDGAGKGEPTGLNINDF